MFNFISKMVDVFIPGVGNMSVPKDEVDEWGVAMGVPVKAPYKSVGQIKKEAGAKKERKPVFICSGSRCFKKRIGRIIYGKEGEDILL